MLPPKLSVAPEDTLNCPPVCAPPPCSCSSPLVTVTLPVAALLKEPVKVLMPSPPPATLVTVPELLKLPLPKLEAVWMLNVAFARLLKMPLAELENCAPVQVATPALLRVRVSVNCTNEAGLSMIPPFALSAPEPARLPPVQVKRPVTASVPVPFRIPPLMV